MSRIAQRAARSTCSGPSPTSSGSNSPMVSTLGPSSSAVTASKCFRARFASKVSSTNLENESVVSLRWYLPVLPGSTPRTPCSWSHPNQSSRHTSPRSARRANASKRVGKGRTGPERGHGGAVHTLYGDLLVRPTGRVLGVLREERKGEDRGKAFCRLASGGGRGLGL